MSVFDSPPSVPGAPVAVELLVILVILVIVIMLCTVSLFLESFFLLQNIKKSNNRIQEQQSPPNKSPIIKAH